MGRAQHLSRLLRGDRALCRACFRVDLPARRLPDRLASIVVFVGIVSFEHRAASIWNSGDGLLRNITFLLMFAPAGASLSVDRWRRAHDRFWEFPARAPWALRLVQIQLSAVYLGAVWLKLHAPAWLHGTAVSYAARLEDFPRFPLPNVFSHSPFFSSVLTYWTIAVELMVGILVWNRAARPLVLSLGVALHVTVGLNMELGFFSETMLAVYLAFLTPTFASACILALRDGVNATTGRAGPTGGGPRLSGRTTNASRARPRSRSSFDTAPSPLGPAHRRPAAMAHVHHRTTTRRTRLRVSCFVSPAAATRRPAHGWLPVPTRVPTIYGSVPLEDPRTRYAFADRAASQPDLAASVGNSDGS